MPLSILSHSSLSRTVASSACVPSSPADSKHTGSFVRTYRRLKAWAEHGFFDALGLNARAAECVYAMGELFLVKGDGHQAGPYISWSRRRNAMTFIASSPSVTLHAPPETTPAFIDNTKKRSDCARTQAIEVAGRCASRPSAWF